MNNSLLIGLVAGAAAVTTVGAMAGYKSWAARDVYADVTSVKPAFKTIKTPRQACHDEAVTRQKPVKDEHKVAGTVIGAVLGGVVGNQFGGGDGKKLATVAGAAAGGYAGNTVQGRVQAGNTETVSEQRCETVYDVEKKPIGYDVNYQLGEKSGSVRMDHDPGKKIPVKDGKLVLTDAEASTAG